jgi:hypothetical protein
MSDGDRLRAELDEAHQRFLDTFDGFNATVLETEPIAGVWSARDLAGHLADWEDEIRAAAEYALGGPEPRGQPIPDGQAFNTMRAALRGADPWDVTVSDFRASWERSATLLAGLSAQDLKRIGRMPWREVGPVAKFFAAMIEHVDEHMEDVETWRERKLGLRPRQRRDEPRRR